jgi:hypothetical protein
VKHKPRTAEDRALQARHNAALSLLRHGIDLDGELLLSYVVWPTDRLQSASTASRRRAGRRPQSRTEVHVGA